jgi:hypothetical protein
VLRLLRTNQPLVILLILLYAFIVRVYTFTSVPNWEPLNSNLISDYIYSLVGVNTFANSIVALFLVVLQAVAINLVVNNYKMGRELTYFPAMSYVLLASAIPEFLYLSPALMGNTFVIVAIAEMFRWYRKYEASAQIFNVGFWIAISAMFYFSNIAFYFLAIIALFNLRSFQLNELLILTIGLFIPFFFVGVYQFWNNGLDTFMSQYVWSNFSFLDWKIESVTHNYLKIVFFISLLAWVFFQSQAYFFKTNIQNQKYIIVLFWSMLIAMMPAIFQSNLGLDHLLLLCLPLSIFIAFNLINIQKRVRAEIVHVVLLLVVLSFHYKELVYGIFFVE